MKYFIVNGERITEEELLARATPQEIKKEEKPAVEELPVPTLPLNKPFDMEEGWTEERRLDGVERVRTGKKRKKVFQFIGKEKSQIPFIKYLQEPPELSHWDYSYLKSHTNTWTPSKIKYGLKREVFTKLAYHFKLYDDPDCYGASKEWLYNRLMDLSRRKRKYR